MECTPFVWEVAWFYSGRILFLAEILSGFFLPLLHFPQREEIPGNPSQSGSRFPVRFLPAFLPLIPPKQGRDLIFKGVCEEPWAAEFAEQHSLYLPLISVLLVPGYHIQDIRKSSSKRSTLLFRRDLGKNWGCRRSFWDAESQISEGTAPSNQGVESHPNTRCFSIDFVAFPGVSPAELPLHPLSCQVGLWWISQRNRDVTPEKVLPILLEKSPLCEGAQSPQSCWMMERSTRICPLLI